MKRRRSSGFNKPATRRTDEQFLVGFPAHSISGSKLPTLRQALQYAIHLQQLHPKAFPIRSIVTQVVNEVVVFWSMARIKTITQQNCINRLLNEWENWKKLKKNSSREQDSGNKRKKFVVNLDKLWDIGAPEAIEEIRSNRLLTHDNKEDDIDFYIDQRNDRVATMNGFDKNFHNKRIKQISRKEFATTSNVTTHEIEEGDLSDGESLLSVSSQHTNTSSDFEIAETTVIEDTFVTLRAPRAILNNPEISAAFDRLKLTDNSATMLISAFIRSCNGDLEDFTLSRSTTRRSRMVNRLGISDEIHKAISQNPPEHIALHWDGKLTKDRFGEKYEALAVVVSGNPDYTSGKLLGIQKLENAAGQSQAEGSFDLLEVWNLTESVKALVFDTTSSNSGWKSGAAKMLEELIGRKLFYFGCRHHVYELIIGAVWKEVFKEASTGPENQMFKDFKGKWNGIDKSKDFLTLTMQDGLELEWKQQAIFEITMLMGKDGFRNDYRQCGENALALLQVTKEKFHHYKPGAAHNARWMGQLLYAQKMFMWASQLQYDDDRITSLERINKFICLFYVTAWLKSSVGVDAPLNDLQFIKNMYKYMAIEKDIATVALKKILKHSWYLSEEVVVFTLFSDNPAASLEIKSDMAIKLLSVQRPHSYRTGVNCQQLSGITDKTTLSDFIGPNSWFLFDTLNVGCQWLSEDARNWSMYDEFMKVRRFVSTVKVVNDAAERGVKMSSDYAAILTDNPLQRSSLLQAVEAHRKKFPDFKRSTLNN